MHVEREGEPVRTNRVIQKRIRRNEDGANVVGDINAAIAANTGESGTSHSRVVSRQRIVQRSGKTEESEVSSRELIEENGEKVVDRETTSFVNAQNIVKNSGENRREKGDENE